MAAVGLAHALFVGMVGKITKLAAGTMMTHYRRSKVDGNLLAAVARSVDAPEEVVRAATATATARHFFEACVSHGVLAPLRRICELAREACHQHTNGVVSVEVLMCDFEGRQVVVRA
jgi:cobalt-precorrin-5B (C1)-methyltransferase